MCRDACTVHRRIEETHDQWGAPAVMSVQTIRAEDVIALAALEAKMANVSIATTTTVEASEQEELVA